QREHSQVQKAKQTFARAAIRAQHTQPADDLMMRVEGMVDAILSDLWTVSMHRFLAEGINYRDLLDLRERITTIGEWPARWSEMAVHYEQRGEAALASGFAATAGAHLTRAALHYFFGQFLLWDDAATKRAMIEKAAGTLRRAGPYLDPPLLPLEIPFRAVRMPGYLRLPAGIHKPPCVLLLNG